MRQCAYHRSPSMNALQWCPIFHLQDKSPRQKLRAQRIKRRDAQKRPILHSPESLPTPTNNYNLPTMHVHFVAVAGTGMGALAGLFKELGHDVSGSDIRFDPPMGPALLSWGIRLTEGFDPAHLSPAPDLVVIGNVCRSNNPQARAAIDAGIPYTDMAHGLARFALANTTPVVVAGTHGKTTTSSLCAWLLFDAGKDPGMLVGGIPKNFGKSFRVSSRRCPSQDTQQVSEANCIPLRNTPFVIEGDEYDTAFFEKSPKFWHYQPQIAVLTSIEHDHIDIYPTMDAYLDAFQKFVRCVPESGLIVACASSERVVEVVREHARCEVAWYALQGEPWHGCDVQFVGTLADSNANAKDDAHYRGQAFDLSINGVAAGRFVLPQHGAHNVSNAIAAIAVASRGFGVPIQQLQESLPQFEGVCRRQDLIGTPNGICVYDDFAHHPTAVDETLRGLRARHPNGSLFAVFEPRSATACRALHQDAYAQAFSSATHVIIAPVGRDSIPAEERLDVARITEEIRAQGRFAKSPASVDGIIDELVREARSGDTIVLLSNGSFGGIYGRLLEALNR